MNLIVRLLLELGIVQPAEGKWSEIKARQRAKIKLTDQERFESTDFTHDPIQAPRRYVAPSESFVSWMHLIPILVIGIGAISLLIWASNEWVWSDKTDEKLLRAEWQNKTRTMSCLELKKIIENDPEDLPNVAWSFSSWEYKSMKDWYPSPRPDNECYEKTGWLRNDVEACDGRKTIFGCYNYKFPRDEEAMTITFPKDWHYVDPNTETRITIPEEYLASYHPKLVNEKWRVIINGT